MSILIMAVVGLQHQNGFITLFLKMSILLRNLKLI